MEFTEAIPAFGGKASLSPNGRFMARLAPSSDFHLLIQETGTLSTILSVPIPLLMDNDAAAGLPKSRHFPPPKPRRILPQDIQLIWSPDSGKLMIVDCLVNRIFIYDHQATDSEALVLQETLPTRRFLWAPDSRHVISVLDHRIGLRVWSLKARFPVRSITNIKSSTAGIDFCREGGMMAVLHRKDAQDFIAIYSCRSWCPIQILRPPESLQLEEIQFSSGLFSRNHFAERPLLYAWELPCLSSRLLIFDPDGSCKVVDVFDGQADIQESFGFSKVIPSPSADIAALIGNDGRLVLWNNLLQKPITKLTITADLARLPHLIAFRERVVYGEEAKFVKYESGYDLMLNELQTKNGNYPLVPVVEAKFSSDSKYLAIHSSAFPNHLWIYHVPSLAFIAVLCQLSTPTTPSVRSFDWHPEHNLLGLVTGSEYVYFWQPEGCHCIPQPFTEPEERCSRSFEWSSCESGSILLLSGNASCCLAVPDF